MFELINLQYPFLHILLGAIILALLLSIIALWVALHSKQRIACILGGKKGSDIDDILMQIYKNISAFDQFKNKTALDIQELSSKSLGAVSSVETIRFNPFKGTGGGGNQSFATAFLDRRGNGVIISSLYSSDRIGIFAKPVMNFTSTFELTTEEQEVLQKAIEKIK